MKTRMQTAVLPLALMMGWAASGAAQAETTFSVISGLSKVDDQVKIYLKHFHEPFNAKKTGLTLAYRGGPEVTPRTKQGAALKRGTVDVIFTPSSYYAGMVPEARTLLLSNRDPDDLRREGVYDYIRKGWAKNVNGYFLAWPLWGAADFHLYFKQKPKLNKETGLDLEGVRVRSTAGYNPFLKRMKATPVVISATEIYTALQRGVVDGFAFPEGSISKRGWHEHVKYRLYPGFFRSSTAVVVNLDKWKSLTQAQRDALEQAAIDYEHASGPAMNEVAAADNARVAAGGVQNLVLEAEIAKAYLETINNATWEFVRDAVGDKLSTPFETLKAGLYRAP